MDYSEEEILKNFKDKECLHKASQRITHVRVTDVKVDKQGVEMKLEVINSKQAVNFHGDLEYEEIPGELNSVFGLSGVWEITSLYDMHLYVAYVGDELNAKPESVQLFKDGELDFFKLWKRSK